MKSKLMFLLLFFSAVNCSSSQDMLTSEIKTIKLLQDSIKKSNYIPIDIKTFLTREQIDSSNVPLLFVELESRQNGTLTVYPGKGIGTTWLGIDGATITFDRGVLIASRGMGDDVMGGKNYMPDWNKINGKAKYKRSLSYLISDNTIVIRNFKCEVENSKQIKTLKIFNVNYKAVLFIEKCSDLIGKIENKYYIEGDSFVRKTYQYHSDTLGYIHTERVDR